MIGETELQQIYWKRFKENIMPHEHSKSFGKLISYSLPQHRDVTIASHMEKNCIKYKLILRTSVLQLPQQN